MDKFKEGDLITVFNSKEWGKTGDLPEGNNRYFQPAIILKLRKDIKGKEDVADVVFENGEQSKGHFLNTITHC